MAINQFEYTSEDLHSYLTRGFITFKTAINFSKNGFYVTYL